MLIDATYLSVVVAWWLERTS